MVERSPWPWLTARPLRPEPYSPPPNTWGESRVFRLDEGTAALSGLDPRTGALSGLDSGTGALSGLDSGTGALLGLDVESGALSGLDSGTAFIEATGEASDLGMASVAMTREAASFRRVSMDKTREDRLEFIPLDKTRLISMVSGDMTRLWSGARAICRLFELSNVKVNISISNKCCTVLLKKYIHQRILKNLGSTTVFNIDNNQKCFLSSKSAY